MTKPSATYESAEWSYNHETTLAAGGRPSCMITGVQDLPKQIADMRAQGYVIHGIIVHTYCGVCQGSGRVPKRSRALYVFKVCKACKGLEGPLSSCKYDHRTLIILLGKDDEVGFKQFKAEQGYTSALGF